MSYLQLADNGNPSEKYFLIPAEISGQSETKFIREDMFDDLPEYKYQQLLYALEPYQLSEDFLSSKASREARRAKRKEKKEMKELKKAGKSEAKLDKQAQRARRREARTAKQEAKSIRKQQEMEDPDFERRGFASVLDTIGGVASNIFGKGGELTGGMDFENGDFSYDMGYEVDNNWIKGIPNWLVIAGGGALTIGTIYLLTKKK